MLVCRSAGIVILEAFNTYKDNTCYIYLFSFLSHSMAQDESGGADYFIGHQSCFSHSFYCLLAIM